MTGTVQTVTSWEEAIFLALSGALSAVVLFVLKLLGALVVLLIGWLLAKAVEALVTKGLRAVRFDAVAQRAEIDEFLNTAGVGLDPAAVGTLAYGAAARLTDAAQHESPASNGAPRTAAPPSSAASGSPAGR